MAILETKTSLAVTSNKTVNSVMARINAMEKEGRLQLPPNYSAYNALMSAYLILQNVEDKEHRPALQVCTSESIANALLDMTIQGLNPAKAQGYFIVYGKRLIFQRGYFGAMAVTKRVTGCQDIFAEVVYEGDTFEYLIARGKKEVVNHLQNLANIAKGNILAGYCVIVGADGSIFTDILTIQQIHQAWRQSRQSPFDAQGNLDPKSNHAKFPAEMAKRTLINHACKMYINSSNDKSLVLVKDAMNRSDDDADEASFAEEVAENANSQTIDAEYTEKPGEEAQAVPAQPEPQPQATAPQPAPAPATPQQPAAQQPQAAKRRRPDF